MLNKIRKKVTIMEMEPEKILTIEEIIERDEKIEKLRKEFKII